MERMKRVCGKDLVAGNRSLQGLAQGSLVELAGDPQDPLGLGNRPVSRRPEGFLLA